MRRSLGVVLFGAAGLLSAAVAWLALGRAAEPVVLRAIASAPLAGALLGMLAVDRITDREPKTALRVGAVVGLLLHPMTWLIFATWGHLSPVAESVGGSLLDAWSNALVWSIASVPHGAALTLPVCIGAAFIMRPRQ